MSLEDEAEQLFLPKTETNLKQAVGTKDAKGTALTRLGCSGYKTEIPSDEERPNSISLFDDEGKKKS